MKNRSGLLAVLAIFLCVSFSNAQTFPIRINTGGAQITGADGNVYEADNSSYYTSGTLTSTRNVDGLVPPYNTIRYAPDASGKTMTYTIPVPNGDYDVKLHFAETWFGTTGGGTGAAGLRIFDVNIEGGATPEIDNMDLYALYGAATPHIRTFTNITVSDGDLTIYFTSQSADGGIKHPLINAIEVFEVDSTPKKQGTPSGSSITSNSISLSWGRDATVPISGYNVYAKEVGVSDFVYNNYIGGTYPNITAIGLNSNSDYQFQVAAIGIGTPGIEGPLSDASVVYKTLVSTDIEIPIAPTLVETARTTNSISFSWSGATDNVAVDGYNLYDGVQSTAYSYSSSDNIATISGLAQSTSYTFTIRAVDAAGNESNASNTIQFYENGGGTTTYDPDFVLRINSGGTSTTLNGVTFLADQDFVGGNQTTTPNTVLSEPYNTERYGSTGNMSYNIAVTDGQYEVVLSFVELYWGATGGGVGEAGRRVFDVNIEGGTKELENFDVFVEVGAETLIQKTFIADVIDGELNIDFIKSDPNSSHHPQITAIEVLGSNFIDPGTPTPSSSLWTKSTVNTNNIFYNIGNVGIGVTNPDAPLTVNGQIHSKEVKVDLAGALVPDYVFLKDYDLKTLEELELTIKELGHLPKIPSAKEMEENGMGLKAMNLSLLEKIEELTLYIIQQNKAHKQLEERIQVLETQK